MHVYLLTLACLTLITLLFHFCHSKHLLIRLLYMFLFVRALSHITLYFFYEIAEIIGGLTEWPGVLEGMRETCINHRDKGV